MLFISCPRRFLAVAVLLFLSLAMLTSCELDLAPDSGSDGADSTSSIAMALVDVPDDALCLEVTVTPAANPSGAQTELFTITPGTSATITMDGLPAGSATITERAFGVACGQVQSDTAPTWISAVPVTVTLVPGQTVAVEIVLQRAGQVQITTTFDEGSLALSPAAMSFGDVTVGSSTTLTMAVTNTSGTTITLGAATASGADASQFSISAAPSTAGCQAGSFVAGATCYYVVEFAPTSAGDKSATFNQDGATASLTGTGVAGSVTLDPPQIDFGSVTVGSSSTETLTVTNPTSDWIAIAHTFTGTDALQFRLVGSSPSADCTGDSIAAGATCYYGIEFTPASAGTKTATLNLGGATASLTGTGVGATAVHQINCGSGNAVSPFAADQYVSGGTQRTVTNSVSTSGAADEAPQAVYQSERYGNSTYTFPSLTPSAQYTVRLHFAELYQTASGRRVFNVDINGTRELSNFDIYAEAGGNYTAIVREFAVTADASGRIVVAFTTVTDNATIEGIEILQ